MRDIKSTRGGGGDDLAQTVATHLHAQLGLPDKVRAIKGVGYLLISMVRIYKGEGS